MGRGLPSFCNPGRIVSLRDDRHHTDRRDDRLAAERNFPVRSRGNVDRASRPGSAGACKMTDGHRVSHESGVPLKQPVILWLPHQVRYYPSNRMNLILQIWGGGCYLANKILFSIAEDRSVGTRRILRIVGWIVYILGVPAWVLILVGRHNWIAAAIEAGGLPAMVYGLAGVIAGEESGLPPSRIRALLRRIASISTYLFIIAGVGYSIIEYGGITTVTQVLEIGVTIGFLLGSYLLAARHTSGWLFFGLMNLSMGTLMLVQQQPILAGQQAVSLAFVGYGFFRARANLQSR